MSAAKVSRILTMDDELHTLICEAHALEDTLQQLDHHDQQYNTLRHQLRYAREEVGTRVIWQCQIIA